GCGDAGPTPDGLAPTCLPDGCCVPDLCQPSHFWVNGEYLLWWIKDGTGPALVTTSPQGTPIGAAGILGQRTTSVLFSGTDLDYSDRSGGRFSAGYWFDSNQCIGIDGSFLFLGQRSAEFSAGSAGNPILARPFFNVTPGFPIGEARELVAFPAVLNGMVTVQ